MQHAPSLLAVILALVACHPFIAIAVQAEARQASNWTVGQTVPTTSGPVNGHPATNRSTVSEYLGIPYAQAPVGNLRFAAPQKYEGTATLNGSSYGFSCPAKPGSKNPLTPEQLQAANATLVGLAVLAQLSNGSPEGEDCLSLNVWTKPQVGEVKKAVMIWIYGGGFNSGTSSVPGYNGANWAEQEDVVLVTINYRLSIFGFPGDPTGPNNLGLLDQRLAVEWVRDNIANFGGDPTRITLFGQSAGAASVDFYSYAWKSDPIVAGLIPESGSVFSWGLPNSKAYSANAWFSVANTLGCGNENSTDQDAVTACMRAAPVPALFAAIPPASLTAGILGYFGPTVDDEVVFANYSTIQPANVPILMGSNDYEGGLFRTQFALAGLFLSETFWNDFNLQEFTCPCGIRANASTAAGVPTWRYRYFGVWPNLQVSSEAGTWHAAEVALLFDTIPTTVPYTEQQKTFAPYMRGAWATFAKDPQKGLLTYGGGWPLYDTNQDTLVRLAFNSSTGPNLIRPYRYDAGCPFVNVSSTNPALAPNVPDLGAFVTPTGTASLFTATATGSTSTTGTATGTAPLATSTGGAERNHVAYAWASLVISGMVHLLS